MTSRVEKQFVSPHQAAKALGVSESSLKRWCDQGLITAVRTAGGHRKLAIAEILRFLKQSGQQIQSPEILGLPPIGNQAELSLNRAGPRLVRALLDGNEQVSRQLVFDLFLGKHSLSVIFDDVIAAAFHDIGREWECHTAEVYQERRACEIVQRILYEIRRALPEPDGMFPAIGGTIEGDEYALPTTMVELILREAGFTAASMGTNVPFHSIAAAVRDTYPKLVWLSVSHIDSESAFIEGLAKIHTACCEVGAALAIGGRALHESLRRQINYSAFCDTMRHLDDFARMLRRSFAKRSRK